MLDEPLPDVRERVRSAGWDTCIVINEQRVMLGRTVAQRSLPRSTNPSNSR